MASRDTTTQRLPDGGNAKAQIERVIADDPKVVSAIKRAVLARRAGPTTRQQASFVDWQRLAESLGQPFDAELVPFSKLRQMRRDPMIGFGLHYIKTPLVRAPWRIRCIDPQVAAFVDTALRPIYARLIFQACNALDFGFQAAEKEFKLDRPQGVYVDENGNEQPIWSEGTVDAVMLKPMITMPPETVRPAWTEDDAQQFNGIIFEGQQEGQGAGGGAAQAVAKAARGGSAGGGQDAPTIDVHHSMWFTNEKDTVWGSVYGYPRISYAYRYWWSYWFRWTLADRAFERNAVPPLVGYHPDGRYEDEEGNRYDNLDVMLDALGQIRSGVDVALPSEPHEAPDGAGTNTPQWKIDYLRGGDMAMDFDKSFGYLDVLKLRSVFVPEQAFVEGEGGTSSRNVAAQMAEIFIQSQTNLMAEIDDHINRYIIPQLVLVNFPEFIGECVKETTGFSSDDIAFMKQIVQLIGNDNWVELGIDVNEAMERVGLPTLSPAKREEERARLIQESALTQPALAPGVPGEAAGVVADESIAAGFSYMDPGEAAIMLADASEFLASLPATQHFADPDIRKASAKIQSAWARRYANLYSDFSRYAEEALSESSLELADEDSPVDEAAAAAVSAVIAKKVAEKIVSAWTAPVRGLKTLGSITITALRKVIGRAAILELDRAKQVADLSRDDVSEWSEERLGHMLATTEQTVRRELTDFVASRIEEGLSANEISKSITEHFSDFPRWKADRVARTEAQTAYNVGTVFAARSAGVDKLLAHDASDGTDDDTDKECIRRNGRLFEHGQALRENEDEHPNGTLYFTLWTAGDTEQVEASAEDMDGLLARYDNENNTVLLSDTANHQQRYDYMVALSEALLSNG